MTRLSRVPALDGVRGLAVGAVLLFHAGVSWAVGGHLGVTVFFALSGFLITSLLLSEHERTGGVDLRAFWARRAKRLVPALPLALVLVAAVAAWTPNPADGLLQDAVATMTWSANWWFLHDGQTYADLFHDPSPLQHTWSLAVEEQYYVVFPLLLLLLVRRGRTALGIGIAALATAAVVDGGWLSQHGATSTRLHYGTDVRVAEILVGAGLAVLLQHGTGWRVLPRWWARAAGCVAAASCLLLLWAVGTVQDDSRFLQRGGWALVALGSCAVLVTAVQPGGVAGRVLGLPPLVRLGQISYGAYLYHWPLYLLIDEQTTGQRGVLLVVLRLTAVLLLAEVSLQVLELPVRQSELNLAGGLTSWALAGTAGVVAVGLGTGAIVLPTLPAPPPLAVQAQAVAPAPVRQQPGPALPRQRAVAAQPPALIARPAAPSPAARRQVQAIPPAFAQDPDRTPVPPVPAAGPQQLRVAVIGDSLADNLAGGLIAWAQERSDVVVYDLALPGCPLSLGGERRFSTERPFPVKRSCGWWSDWSSERRQAFNQFAPQVVVVEDGVNELFDRRLPDWPQWRAPGDPPFDEWLTQQYSDALANLGEAEVLMVNTPCADWQRYGTFADVNDMDGRITAVNGDQQRVTGISQADLRQRICPGGRYSDDVEGDPNGRPDGLHLSAQASYALARNWLGPLVLVTGKPAGLLGPGL